MRIHQGLVRLYPAAFRERWGSALEADAQAAGWRSWPGLLAGIADMWLHPAIWPADSRTQRRARATTLAITVAVCTALLGRAAEAQGVALASTPGGSWTAPACAVLFLLGLVLVAPLPRPSRAAVTALLGRAARRLAAPALLASVLLAVAHLDPTAVATGPWHHVGVVCYWTTLAVGTIQTCRVFTGLGDTVLTPPRRGRLVAGMGSLTAASVLAGSIVLATSAAHPAPDTVAVAAGAALVLLAWALSTTLRDLWSATSD